MARADAGFGSQRRLEPAQIPERALAGFVLWAALAVATAGGVMGLTLIDLLLVFGLLFVVPLGLDEAGRLGVHVPSPAMGAAAIPAAVSLLLRPGAGAAALAAVWLGACLLMALSGLASLAAQRSFGPRTLLPVAALAYLAVGAGWLVVSRLGATPLGFSDIIVELTAVHFHFAGFAAPLIAAATAQAIGSRGARPSRLPAAARIGGMGVVVAMPVVAAGFVASRELAAAGAVLLVASLGVLAVVMLILAAAWRGTAGALLALASVSVLGAMAVAAGYALGPFLGLPIPTIPRMVQLHGSANALGFCGAGLLGYALAGNRRRGG